MTNPTDAPGADEVEVSLFGPGLGESIVLHLGNGEWAIVDSCLGDEGAPAAASYLEALGIDLAEQVVLLVATHWHDDHVGGLAELVRRCEMATFAYSAALNSDEFTALVGVSERLRTRRSGVSEFAALMKVLRDRNAPSMALQDRVLWERPEHYAFVRALSPSDKAVLLSQQTLAAAFPAVSSEKVAIRPVHPNHASVVLWVGVGPIRILLGADLEETSDPDTGWTAILDRATLPGHPGSLFKIPHHGSPTGHQDRVWDKALIPEPHALVTPFVRGNVQLPAVEDRTRIKSLTPHAFITSDQPRRRRRRPGPVEKTLRESKIDIREADPPLGHLQLRRKSDVATWSVHVDAPAAPL